MSVVLLGERSKLAREIISLAAITGYMENKELLQIREQISQQLPSSQQPKRLFARYLEGVLRFRPQTVGVADVGFRLTVAAMYADAGFWHEFSQQLNKAEEAAQKIGFTDFEADFTNLRMWAAEAQQAK